MIDKILKIFHLVKMSDYDCLNKKYDVVLKNLGEEYKEVEKSRKRIQEITSDNELLRNSLSKAKLEVIELKKKNEELESLPKLIKLPSPKRTPIQKRTTKSSSKQSAIVKKMYT